MVVGVGKEALKPQDFVKLGGVAMGKIPNVAREATVIAENHRTRKSITLRIPRSSRHWTDCP